MKKPVRVYNANLMHECSDCEARYPRMYRDNHGFIVCGRCPRSVQWGERKNREEI